MDDEDFQVDGGRFLACAAPGASSARHGRASAPPVGRLFRIVFFGTRKRVCEFFERK